MVSYVSEENTAFAMCSEFDSLKMDVVGLEHEAF